MRITAIIATLPVKISEKDEKEFFGLYIAKGIQILTENTGGYTIKDINEIMNMKPDNRTGEEIVADVIKGAGLEVVEDEERV